MRLLTDISARIALATMIGALLAASAPGAARAGTYTVHACKTPTGGTASVADWRVTSAAGKINQAKSGCPAQALKLSMLSGVAHPANDSITAAFSAPQDTELAGYTLWRSVKLAAPYNYYTYETTRSGAMVMKETCAGSCGGLGGAQPLGSANRVTASNLTDVRSVAVRLTCGLGDSSSDKCPGDDPAAQMWLHRADVVLNDPYAPVISSPPTGPLVSSSAPLTGVQQVSIAATDRGGGVYQALFEVDGKIVSALPIDTNGGACVPPFTAAVPCKLSASNTLGLDTARFADGPHSLRLLVTDATGTNTAAWGPITIVTANSACNPQPRVNSLKLRAGVARGHGKRRALRSVVTTAYGRRVRISGRLVTPAGAPVAGAGVCVAEQNDAENASLRPGPSFTTDADGRFSYLSDRGPSRRVYFVYRAPEGAVTTSVLVNTRASLRFAGNHRTLHTGQSILLRGTLRGRPIPAQGVLVEIQARRATGWQTFGTARTSSTGRFRFRYRFVRTRGVERYKLRARVPRQPAYPYATGAAKAFGVRVVGP